MKKITLTIAGLLKSLLDVRLLFVGFLDEFTKSFAKQLNKLMALENKFIAMFPLRQELIAMSRTQLWLENCFISKLCPTPL